MQKPIKNRTISLKQETERLRQENKTIKEELSRKSQHMEAMLKGTGLLLASEDFTKTAGSIFNYCKDLIGARAGYIALLNKDKMENEVVYLESGGMNCTVSLNLPMPIRGLRAEAYSRGEAVYDNNYSRSPHMKFMPKGHIPLRNVMFAPIRIEGETIGLMGLGEKKGNFNDKDKEIATIMAEFVAIALVNSKMLDELKQSQIQLHKMNETKDKFFSIIAHDLKNPFAALSLTAELIHRQLQNPEMDRHKLNDYSKVIYDTASTGRSLLEDLLKWSMSQFGSLEFEPVDFNLQHAVAECLLTSEATAINKGIKIHSSIPAHYKVHADKSMVQTVIRNLLTNAIKFTERNGEVFVTARKRGDQIKISVKDTGVGMSKGTIKKLFRIDKKYTTPGTNNEKGTGYGLILCKEFIEKNGGTISVRSVEGQGSEFTFTLKAV